MVARDAFGLHDEMGVGKTPTTITAINDMFAERGIIVCPAMLKSNWVREAKRFGRYGLKYVKARTIHDYVAWQRRRFDVLISSYEHITKWAPHFMDHGEYPDFIAMDEGHYLKNVEANRTKAVLGDAENNGGIVKRFGKAWHITGTPMTGSPMDAYTFLRFVGATNMTQADFTKTFFRERITTYGTKYFVKDDMAHTLQQMLRANSIRRTHQDVGMFLPPIWLNEVLIDGDTSQIAEAIKDYPYIEEQIVAAIENNDLSLLNAAHIATVRRLVGKAKAAAYAPMLKAELDAGRHIKHVAFFSHTEPLLFVYNYLQKYGYKPVVVYGDLTQSQADRAVELYQTDPTVGPILLNITKGGVGLNLVEGATEDVVESSWVPSTNAQALKRVHRYGQRQEVHARFITLADSLDVQVNQVVSDKTAEIAKVEGFAMTAALPQYAS